jgi:hypothetical protein
MNVPFTLKDANLDGDFVKQADARGLLQLKGHRSVGGMRASIYNAMPLAGVQALAMGLAIVANKVGGFVDLVEPGPIRNPYFKQSIEASRVLLFEAA